MYVWYELMLLLAHYCVGRCNAVFVEGLYGKEVLLFYAQCVDGNGGGVVYLVIVVQLFFVYTVAYYISGGVVGFVPGKCYGSPVFGIAFCFKLRYFFRGGTVAFAEYAEVAHGKVAARHLNIIYAQILAGYLFRKLYINMCIIGVVFLIYLSVFSSRCCR